ncbi:inositol polyphosphate 5-phosphatase [Rhizoclosmatium sp. JEL0117]|nr:inositol polyphosphate 5-phosphatase [Rhizoclosmatium sp. JEL0117]
MPNAAISDDFVFEYTTDTEIIYGALRGSMNTVLIFNKETGDQRVDLRFDSYTPTPNRVIQETKIYGIVGLLDLCFKKFVIAIDQRELAANIKGKAVWKITGVRTTQYYMAKPYLSLNEEEHERTILGHITSMLTSGLFYFSVDMDVTSSCQATLEKDKRVVKMTSTEMLFGDHENTGPKVDLKTDFEMIDERFMFNKFLLDSLYSLDTFPFIVPTIFGFVGSTEFILDTVTHHYCLISRCSNKRAGTRYFRGLDEHGSSAIEVETEFILITDDKLMAYRQLRGSTPLIWKSSPPDEILQPVNIDLTGAADTTSRDALSLHLYNLIERYKSPVTLLSLLSRNHKKETLALQYQQLADTFQKVFFEIQREIGAESVDLVEFDESDLAKTPDTSMPRLLAKLRSLWKRQGYFSSTVGYTAQMNLNACKTDSLQKGALRINGIDCVDMTNVVQYRVAIEVMYDMLNSCGFKGKVSAYELKKVKRLWVRNGRALALLYTGVSRVLYEEQILKNWMVYLLGGHIGVFVWWAIVRVGRLYMGTFRDSRRQEAFECVLGQTKHTVKDAISVQRSVLKLATNQKSGLALFMLLRRFFSPTHVNTIFNLILAGFWLVAQAIVRIAVGEGVWASTALPRIGSRLDTSAVFKSEQVEAPKGLNSQLKLRKNKHDTELLEMSTEKRSSISRKGDRRLTIS